MTSPLQFWFEFASTYSYPTVMRIEELAQKNNIQIEWRPFLLGPIFQSQGWKDSPFNIYPSKGKYMWRDLERLCDQYKIPFQKPSQFPRNGLLAARIACANQLESWCPSFIRNVFKANFAEDRDISQREVIKEILQSLQLSDEIIDQSSSTENKDKLREQTNFATQLGIFGAPTFIINNELFWGDDRLEIALEWSKK